MSTPPRVPRTRRPSVKRSPGQRSRQARALADAIEAGDVFGARAAVQRGADPSSTRTFAWTKPEVFKSPALWAACYYGHLHIARWLSSLPGVDVNALGQRGFSPLHVSAVRGDTEVLAWLIDHPAANLLAVNDDGHTPFDVARESEQWECVELLRAPTRAAAEAAKAAHTAAVADAAAASAASAVSGVLERVSGAEEAAERGRAREVAGIVAEMHEVLAQLRDAQRETAAAADEARALVGDTRALLERERSARARLAAAGRCSCCAVQ